MISNERPTPSFHRSYPAGSPQSRIVEEILRSEHVQIERKSFTMQLRENPRGRLLRITEDVQGRRSTIIIPAPGLEEFRRVVAEMIKASGEIPLKHAPIEPDYFPGTK